MATEKWIGGSGVGLTWSAAFGTEVNSVVNGNAVASSVVVANASPLDVFADVSLSLGSVTSGGGTPYIGIYLYPLNQDGSTYGDGRFGSSASGTPPSQYFAGSVPIAPSTTGVIVGMARGIILPPGSFKFLLFNQAGATLAASSNTIQYRTYNRQIV